MVKHVKNDVAISDQIDKEIKAVLRDKLGAELVESVDPMYADDPAVPEHEVHVPGRASPRSCRRPCRSTSARRPPGELEFAVPGWDVTSRRLPGRAVDAQGAAVAEADPAAHQPEARQSARHRSRSNKYLAERGDARVKDWAAGSRTPSSRTTQQRAGAVNAAVVSRDPRADARRDQLPEDAVGAADGDPEGDVRERHRRVRESGADDAAVQARA